MGWGGAQEHRVLASSLVMSLFGDYHELLCPQSPQVPLILILNTHRNLLGPEDVLFCFAFVLLLFWREGDSVAQAGLELVDLSRHC